MPYLSYGPLQWNKQNLLWRGGGGEIPSFFKGGAAAVRRVRKEGNSFFSKEEEEDFLSLKPIKKGLLFEEGGEGRRGRVFFG